MFNRIFSEYFFPICHSWLLFIFWYGMKCHTWWKAYGFCLNNNHEIWRTLLCRMDIFLQVVISQMLWMTPALNWCQTPKLKICHIWYWAVQQKFLIHSIYCLRIYQIKTHLKYWQYANPAHQDLFVSHLICLLFCLFNATHLKWLSSGCSAIIYCEVDTTFLGLLTNTVQQWELFSFFYFIYKYTFLMANVGLNKTR